MDKMIYFNFIAGDNFKLKDLDNLESFFDTYPDFQDVVLDNENELRELLRLMGITNIQIYKTNNSIFSEYWDISNNKLPEFTKEQFSDFYFKWLELSKRDNNMDEYGNLVFLQGISEEWNKKKFRIIVKAEE